MSKRAILLKSSGKFCLACGAEYDDADLTFCLACLRTGTLGPRFFRPADAVVPKTPAITARELLRSHFLVESVKEFPDLKVAPNTFALLYGLPGSGKTLLALLLALSLQPSAYLALEEKTGPSLASKLEFLELHSDRITFYEPESIQDIMLIATQPGLRSLVIDSVNLTVLQAADCLRIARAHNIVVVAISQCTKEGLPRGSNEFNHLADCVIEVSSMNWRLTKSRFQQAGIGGPVL